MIDEALRRSAAHVAVTDVWAPNLDEGAGHHVRRVLRLRDGEVVTATDGVGRWRSCRLAGDLLRPDGPVNEVERPVRPVTVAVAAPKGERLDWLVHKCTEVGVDRVVLLTAERSVVRWDPERAERQLARLRRIAKEAALQARRVWFPELTGPVPAAAVLPRAAAAEPGGRPLGPEDRFVAVGPEGGWTSSELDVAPACVSLGDTVLRVETAAVAAAVLMTALRRAAP